MKKILLLIFLFYSAEIFSQSVEEYSIHSDWYFRKSGEEKWLPANVPGTVHTDLLANKIIEDPYFRDNEKNLQWIENEDWEYKTSFKLEEKSFHKQNIELIFNGLDTYAKVFLNDSLILTADNMFRTWKVECKKFMKRGENELYILFESPIKKTKAFNKNLPGAERVYTRKAAYQYGWDFGPRFVTCGVWRKIEIKAWDYFIINDVRIIQNKITDSKAYLTMALDVNSTGNSDFLTHIVNKNNPEENIHKQDKIIQGNNIIKVDFEIANPKLWWCNGLGEPEMYKFFIEATDNHERWDNKEIETGLRTLELVQERDSAGSSFYFKLNGVPVFAKGANFVPTDCFLPRTGKEKYRNIISDAVSSGMNILRIWGGGVYEDDEFYKLCDENGILVWQDFMFACAMYPGDDDFLQNVKQEAIDNITRLCNHPCIALWCGNNEIDEGWKNWGWQKEFKYSADDSVKIRSDYNIIFNNILPDALKENLVNGFNYIPSSPKIGWGHPESMTEGDSHYWGVWWGMEPFEVYKQKVPRFMSEYGFQGFPDKKTIEEFSNPDERYLYSDIMKSHQKHPTGYETIQTYLEREYKTPNDFESYNYISQLLQAYGIKTAIEAHRRAKPYCMGTLYWQYNDCWPGVTWSGIDYNGRWKALQYFVKDAYQDILISPVEEKEKIKIYVVSDRLEDVKGFLNLDLLDFNGKLLKQFEVRVSIDKNSSKVYFEIPKKELISGFNQNEILLFSHFQTDEVRIYENIMYFTEVKNLSIPTPNVKFLFENFNDNIFITIMSDKLIKNLYLYTDDDLKFSDNYFDVIPGINKTVSCKSVINENELRKKLKYISLVDVK